MIDIFLEEGSIMGLIGGIFGDGVGILISYVVVRVFSGSLGGTLSFISSGSGTSISPVISPELIVLAILLATTLGALGGLIPAWRAQKCRRQRW